MDGWVRRGSKRGRVRGSKRGRSGLIWEEAERDRLVRRRRCSMAGVGEVCRVGTS